MTPPVDEFARYKFYLDMAQFAMTGALGVYVRFATRARVNQTRFQALEKHVRTKITADDAQAMLDQQLPDCKAHQAQTRNLETLAARLGTELRDSPTRQDLAQIEKNLSRIFSQTAKLEGRFEGIDRLTGLLNEFMVNQGGR